MVIINIDNPIKENMDYSLNEQECNDLMNRIKYVLESEDSLNKALRESGAVELGFLGATAVIGIIGMIKKWIKNKYRMNVEKIISQSKELNDLYTKVEYIISHDKKARFKHRKDVINCDLMNVVLIDEKDPRKTYNVTLDYLGYDPQYFIDEIKSIIDYSNKYSKNKEIDYQNMKANLIKIIDDNYNSDHWYIDSCKPVLKSSHFKNVYLDKTLIIFKNYFGDMYYDIGLINDTVNKQIDTIHYIEQAYNHMMSIYGKDKSGKEITEEVFKKLLKNITNSIDFNNSIVEAIEQSIKFNTDQIEKIYNIIRS